MTCEQDETRGSPDTGLEILGTRSGATRNPGFVAANALRMSRSVPSPPCSLQTECCLQHRDRWPQRLPTSPCQRFTDGAIDDAAIREGIRRKTPQCGHRPIEGSRVARADQSCNSQSGTDRAIPSLVRPRVPLRPGSAFDKFVGGRDAGRLSGSPSVPSAEPHAGTREGRLRATPGKWAVWKGPTTIPHQPGGGRG